MARVTRAERLAQIQALLADGLTHRQIGERLGVSFGAVRNVLNDPDGSKQRVRRTRYQGRCETCGKPTDGSNGRGSAPRLCAKCVPSRRIWTREAIIEAIQRFAAEHGHPPLSTDWQRADRGRGYPPTGSVYRHAGHPYATFDSWADAVAAAGFDRPRVGGYERTSEHRRRLSYARLVWTHELILDAIRTFAERYGRPPVQSDWDPAAARLQGWPERAERWYGDACWPSTNTVARRFGSFGAAVEAAGFPRPTTRMLTPEGRARQSATSARRMRQWHAERKAVAA